MQKNLNNHNEEKERSEGKKRKKSLKICSAERLSRCVCASGGDWIRQTVKSVSEDVLCREGTRTGADGKSSQKEKLLDAIVALCRYEKRQNLSLRTRAGAFIKEKRGSRKECE